MALLPARPAHENAHPLSGEVRRLHTTFANLHGQPFLVVDWYSRAESIVPGATLEAMRQAFIARCAEKCEHPVIEQMAWFFEQRTIVGHLGGTAGTPMIIDTDELPDLKLMMIGNFGNSLSIARTSSGKLLSGVKELTRYRMSAKTASIVQSLTENLTEIVGLLEGDDILVTDAGIARIERANILSAAVHLALSRLRVYLLEPSVARLVRYHAENGWMRHCEYYDRVGGRDSYVNERHDEEDSSNLLEKVETLRHNPSLRYDCLPGTSLYLSDHMEFARRARVTFDWLSAWESAKA